VIATLVALIPASDMAVTVINWDVTHLFPPRLLSKIETESGIPAEAATMVVVPTIFSTPAQVKELLGRLEVHYLANEDPNIYFGLLGDFPDADSEQTPDDLLLLEAAGQGIEELNRRYHKSDLPHFYLFHRRRQWNAGEERWMGWERKRGKLEEFNRLLRGANDTSFVVSTADATLLNSVRFVITLDSDTQLPRDVARKL